MEPLALMIAAFAGWLIVSRAPVILHTPLISSCMFLNSIVAVAGLAVLLNANTPAEQVAGFLTVLFGATNAAAGYTVGAVSLLKFRSAARPEAAAPAVDAAPRRERRRSSTPRRRSAPNRSAKD